MFTDAPGEWFVQWARVPSDPTAAGARWVVEHSDVLLLLIDSAALADSVKLPQTRRATRDLIERLAARGGHQPLLVVWTKDDIPVPEPAREGLERACSRFMPSAETWKTTVERPATIEECFVRALVASERSDSAFDVIEPRQSTDPFLAFRGIHVNT
jgi:hypothetical protein